MLQNKLITEFEMTRIRVRSPSVVRRSPKPNNTSGYRRSSSEDSIDFDDGFGSMNKKMSNNNKVMVVVDSGAEAKAALELALSLLFEELVPEEKARGECGVEEREGFLAGDGAEEAVVMWRLIQRLKSRRIHSGDGENEAVVKYCIQNSGCLTIAVRRQSKKLGRYLITTKRHKNLSVGLISYYEYAGPAWL